METMLELNQREELAPPMALDGEWLDVNSRGGYASGTLLNCHTRKYHGLLVSRLAAPPGCFVLLSKFEDIVSFGENRNALSCHQYPHDFFPSDYSFLKSYGQGDGPSFLYEGEGVRIRKSILMVAQEDSILVRYDPEDCPRPGVVSIRPFLAYRDFHRLSKENPFLRGKVKAVKNGFVISPYAGMPPLAMQTNRRPLWRREPLWYYNFEYAAEASRGYEHSEDLFSPGVLQIPLHRDKATIVYVSTAPFYGRLSKKWDDETQKRRKEAAEDEAHATGLQAAMSFPSPAAELELIRLLLRAGRQFLIRTPAGRPAVIAGYHWFGEWGRDTLISLPGLVCCCGRRREGLEILTRMARFEQQGLLPNIFSEQGADHAYNTVDAPLWYFWAVQQLLKDDDDHQAAAVEKNLWPVLKSILRNFIHGALFNIYMDDNGLLHAGVEGRALTWMDACVGNSPVTARQGYPVEINALWYNAVCFAAGLARRFGDGEFYFDDLIPKIRRSFRETFWSDEDACLGDVYQHGRLDRSIRPNQIFAVSLPHSPLETEQGRLVVEKVRNELLTPVGIRTLSPHDPRYRGRYGGSPAERDGAYHQGTVWPWLLGHFGEAWLKVAADREGVKAKLREYLHRFLTNHFREAGIGCVSEVFDGDPPHRPGGCIAQAWSTAELIRLYSLLGRP